jgi:serine/threonine protein kinase
MDASLSAAQTVTVGVVIAESGGDAARTEVKRAIRINHGEPVEIAESEIHGRFLPARCRDFALRAVRAACDIEVPAAVSVHFTEPGAERLELATHAATGAAVIAEPALEAALAQLPATWEVAHLPHAAGSGGEGGRVLIGPNVAAAPELATFTFHPAGRLASGTAIFRIERRSRGSDLAPQELFSNPQTKRFGRYQLTAIIGRGATAEVWRAHDDGGAVVAIKCLRETAASSEQQARRFEREAAVLARLAHPNICGVREARVTGADRYIVMDFIEGATLAEILSALGDGASHEARLEWQTDLAALVSRAGQKRGGEPWRVEEPPTTARCIRASLLPLPQVLALMRKVAAAVAHAHQEGVLHRDLKPGNILVRPDGEPVVTDFGLAKLTTPFGTSISIDDQILGTLEYMSPEQALSSREVDERADVYALGAILYELLTGRRVFIGSGHLLHDAERLQTHIPVSPRALNADLDPRLELVVLQALRARSAERYGSVGEFLHDLDRFESGEPVHAHPPTFRARAEAVANAFLRHFS